MKKSFLTSETEQTVDKYFDWFKKLFAFLPGVLILHFSVFALLDFGIYGIRVLFWIAAETFMIWAGIGDLKNKKHFAALIRHFSFFRFRPARNFASGKLSFRLHKFLFLHLPLLFITPILTKNYLDKETK